MSKTLHLFDQTNSHSHPHRYWVNVTSLGVTKPGQPSVIYTPRDSFTMPTLIDTGSTLSYIREDLVAQIGQQFGATVDNITGNYIVDCAYRDRPGTVDFGFNRGRMVINVRYKDFVYQQYPGHCMLGVQPADVGSTNYVLGDTFIRGAYCKSFLSFTSFFSLSFSRLSLKARCGDISC